MTDSIQTSDAPAPAPAAPAGDLMSKFDSLIAERQALIDSEPQKFLMPKRSDQRYNWVVVRLEAIDDVEMREIVLDAWRMVVPKRVAAERLGN